MNYYPTACPMTPCWPNRFILCFQNITAIRSTSELLAVQGDMSDKERTKFTHIFIESKRLSTTAEKLLMHFDSKISVNEPTNETAETLIATTSPDLDSKALNLQESLPA